MNRSRVYKNPVSTVSRNVRIAISELFPEAIGSHQGTFYQVTTIAGRRPVFIQPEAYELIRHKVKLFDPVFYHSMPEYPARESFDDIGEWVDAVNSTLHIEEPQTVIAHITEPLSMFRCDKCGSITSAKSGLISLERICPTCGSEMFQAPVLVYKSTVSTENVPPQMVQRISAPPCIRCKKDRKTVWPRMKPLDKRAPFGTLRLYCPEHDRRPDAKGAQSVSRRNRRLTLPSPSIIRPIQTTVCDTQGSSTSLPILGLFDPNLVESVEMYSTLIVHQLVFGYSYPDSGIVKPLDKFLGRKFTTNGFVVTLRDASFETVYENLSRVYRDPDLLDEFTDDLQRAGSDYFTAEEQEEHEKYDKNQLRRWVLHTLGHALLIMLPLKTGLEASRFDYSYDVEKGRIIIYDSEEGGVGGCETVTREDVWPDYIDATKHHLGHCDCRARCYRCLVITGCGEINNALNRHLLGPIFDMSTDYE